DRRQCGGTNRTPCTSTTISNRTGATNNSPPRIVASRYLPMAFKRSPCGAPTACVASRPVKNLGMGTWPFGAIQALVLFALTASCQVDETRENSPVVGALSHRYSLSQRFRIANGAASHDRNNLASVVYVNRGIGCEDQEVRQLTRLDAA